MKKLLFIFIFLLIHNFGFALVTNYFSKSSGSILLLSSWGTNLDGTGSNPTSFAVDSVRYNLYNRSSFILFGLGNWNITGKNSCVIVGNGTTATNLNIPNGYTLKVDSFYMNANSTTQLSGTLECLELAFSLNSSFNYTDTNAFQSILPGKYGNLYLTNGGTKKLKGNIQVRGIFSLQDKLLFCDTFTITLGESPLQPGQLLYNASNYDGRIIGKFQRWMPATTLSYSEQGLFPLGSNNKSYPLYINPTTAPGTGGLVSVEFLPYFAGNSGLPILDSFNIPTVNINRLNSIGYWKINIESGYYGGIFTITTNPVNMNGILWEGALRLIRRDAVATNWGLYGGNIAGGLSAYLPTIGRSGLNSITGHYAIASDSNINVLPVNLLSFNGEISRQQIILKWTTSTEVNSGYFKIEKHQNDNWVDIANIKAKGNSLKLKSYSYSFTNIENTNNLSLRLSAFDKDGSLSASKLLNISNEVEEMELTLLPNPFIDVLTIHTDEVNFKIDNIKITDIDGKMIYSKFDSDPIINDFSIETSNWPSGIYFIKIFQDKKLYYFKIVKL